MLDKIIFLDEFVELQKETTQNFKYENFIFPCFCLVEGKVRAPWDHPKGVSALVSALSEPVQLNLRTSLMEDDGK